MFCPLLFYDAAAGGMEDSAWKHWGHCLIPSAMVQLGLLRWWFPRTHIHKYYIIITQPEEKPKISVFVVCYCEIHRFYYIFSTNSQISFMLWSFVVLRAVAGWQGSGGHSAATVLATWHKSLHRSYAGVWCKLCKSLCSNLGIVKN